MSVAEICQRSYASIFVILFTGVFALILHNTYRFLLKLGVRLKVIWLFYATATVETSVILATYITVLFYPLFEVQANC